MIAADCLVCTDPLGGERIPVAMPCGHLYCLDCATFWFNQGENQKCFCGRTFTGEQIIRLWTSGDSNGAGSSSVGPSPTQDQRGRAALEAANAALSEVSGTAEGSDAALLVALDKIHLFVGEAVKNSDAAGIRNILRDLRSVLVEIRAALAGRDERQQEESSTEVLDLRRALNQASRRIDDLQIREEFHNVHASQLTRIKDDLKSGLEAMKTDLEAARNRLAHVRSERERLKDALELANAEKDKLMKSEVKYKKKYYALKQEQDRIKKRVRRDGLGDEESLIVLH
ncbi:hypothetical protein BDW22DRAFT_1360580 [Trametopsis cervina]|nr:hypothetical protein BDW22DRAFT_1360580 [Trametopsis cervina]